MQRPSHHAYKTKLFVLQTAQECAIESMHSYTYIRAHIRVCVCACIVKLNYCDSFWHIKWMFDVRNLMILSVNAFWQRFEIYFNKFNQSTCTNDETYFVSCTWVRNRECAHAIVLILVCLCVYVCVCVCVRACFNYCDTHWHEWMQLRRIIPEVCRWINWGFFGRSMRFVVDKFNVWILTTGSGWT